MLRHNCYILGPFAKKSVIFRYDSVLRIPFGCTFYRKGVLLHLGNHKHLNNTHWESKNCMYKEQKNFIWTSFYNFQNKKNDGGGHEFDNKNAQNINNENTLLKSNSAVLENTSDFLNIPVKSCDKNKDEFIGLSRVTSNFIDKKGINEKSALHNCESDTQTSSIINKSEKSNVLRESIDRVQVGKKEEVKREVKQIKLGNVGNDLILNQPDSAASSKERSLNEISPSNEATQNILLEKAKGILMKSAVLKPEENRSVKIINLGSPKPNASLNVINRRRQTVDLNRCSTERNFITPVRAMTDFLLKPSDLEGLRKTKRRSPYENDPPITVYWRKDVEAKAVDVWGSKENLLKEILKRDIERRRYQQNLFTVKRRLRDYRREQGRETEFKVEQNGLFGSSGKVVLTAIAINGTNFLFKLLAWLYTGSHSMFSEAIHSLADTINQLILAYGIHKSVQRADSDHPYGYTNMRYVSSLISGVGIFCVGSGLSFYHGFVGLTDSSDLPSYYWAFFILAGSLASEGATLLVAFNSIRTGARKSEVSFSEYVWRGQDPSVNVVLLEDMAAVVGVGFAGVCMGLSSCTNSHIPDAVGSFLVGGLLAGVASFIIYTNVAALVGRSIPQERLDKINAELESDVMIRAIHDVKGIDIGNSLVRYKAEMDFDGGELTRSYLDKQDLNRMLEEVKKMQTIDELEEFMLKHGENIVDMMGGEIDRIELKLRKKHPEIRHCDLEIL